MNNDGTFGPLHCIYNIREESRAVIMGAEGSYSVQEFNSWDEVDAFIKEMKATANKAFGDKHGL